MATVKTETFYIALGEIDELGAYNVGGKTAQEAKDNYVEENEEQPEVILEITKKARPTVKCIKIEL